MRRLVTLVSLLAWCTATHAADLRIAAPFSDHAILQRGMPVPIWGTADPGATVTVTFADQSKSTVTAADGRWRVVLDPLSAGAAGPLVVKSATTITVADVLVGDVWLCAGDSFMSRPITSIRAARQELTARESPPVRLLRLRTAAAQEPQADVTGSWEAPQAGRVGDLPALAYLFAKEVQAATGVPVGIVEATDPSPVGILRGGKVTGSTVEAWISENTLQATPVATPIFDFYRSPAELRDAVAAYETALGDWKLKTGKAFGAELRELEKREPDVWYDYVAEMRKAGKPAPADPPRKPTAESLRMATTRAANLHRGMIAPLSGLAVRGVALSLGTANAPRATQYRTLMPALIRDWRAAWGRADLPFVFLQQGRAAHPNMDPRALAELRDAQAAAADLPQTALVPTIDLAGNVFPEDVPTLARRLAAAAGSVASGESAAPTGPRIEEVRFEGGEAIVRFRAGTSGLAVRGGGTLQGFALTERPNRWAYADARIEGDRVIVSHRQLGAPVALRYDWVVEPGHEGNLVDAGGLPAEPYRSDDWPAFTDTPAALKPDATATIQPADFYPVSDPGLPRVLLIGDSIMNGYTPAVIAALHGKANVVRLVAFGMVGQTEAGVASFVIDKARLPEGDYAVIHYNDGLHSLPPRITDEQFSVGLRAMLSHLQKVAPHVIWATTTPAPDRRNTLGPESQNATVVARNDISRRIAAELGVPVNDLYGLVIGEREKLQGFANLHFTPEGSRLMGEQVAARILEALNGK